LTLIFKYAKNWAAMKFQHLNAFKAIMELETDLNWKFINDSVRLHLFPYRPLYPVSDIFSNTLNGLQFFAGCCYDGLHTSKFIQQPGRSLAADPRQAL
jgi:hypothetical protein